KIEGCPSGTLGYLFGELGRGAAFSTALEGAIAKGYPEPDPREDLSGMDVARKALILGRLLGFSGELDDIAVESLVPEGAERLRLDRFLASLRQFDAAWAQRVAAARARGGVLRYRALLELRHRPPAQGGNALRALFDARWGVRRGALASGVWRYGEAVLPTAGDHILSYPEGNTPLLASAPVARWAGAPELLLKHE